ncbi:formylmethanofuran--tetrahydromethanopterin N-formyltransferase [Candidatus Bathyarchaeota archaeon]|nr:MAG: formylmethanofuran--tetrahydromethanopterin N-formyltransferase [Candidatus Bathyarchaeota archaeon]
MFSYKGVEIEDTFAEMFPLWAGRALITAENEKWALIAARTATGFASSIIMSPAEAGIEAYVPKEETPDGRTGVLIQVYQRDRRSLRMQMIYRIGQCVMTCPTAAAFDGLPKARRRMKVGRALSLFGDGFQREDVVGGRRVWRIPVMEGEFIVEDRFGVMKAVAGGNFLIMAESREAGLRAAEAAVEAISQRAKYVVLPFPGGICRSGSKAGSMKYKLGASTNHPFCPTLRRTIPDSKVPEGVNSIYEIVVNGLDEDAVKRGMAEGIKAAVEAPGVIRISAANYGGRLGPYKAYLKEILSL